MNILCWHINGKKRNFPYPPHDVKWFGEGDSDIAIPPDGIYFQNILDKLPPGWQPDVAIFSDLAYHLIPPGIEEAPFPTAAIISDWNLSFEALKKSVGCFDYIFTDLKGVEVFKRHGYSHVEYFPMFSFDPEIHRPMPDVEKIYDICFIGNLNHAVQRERVKWLRKIAMLSEKYKVIIAGGIYGEDYTRLLNQSRIIFNRSIRGEMNMRAHEAPACRSLLFYEEENLEVRNFYEDRIHCVLYNEENLEELLDHYLRNEGEREAIVQRGYEKVQELSYEKRLAALFEWLENNIDKSRRRKRRIFECTPSDRNRIRADQAFWSITSGGMEIAEEELQKGLLRCPENPELWNNRGVVLIATQGTGKSKTEARTIRIAEALHCFQTAIEKDPAYAPAHFNLACCYYGIGHLESSEAAVCKAISVLKENPGHTSSLSGLYLPSQYDSFKVELERITFSYPDPDQFHIEKTGLVLWRFYDLLGDIYFKKGALALARKSYEQSVEQRPDMGETRYKLGQVMERLGEFEEALQQYKESIKHNPFIFDCWKSQVNLLNLMGLWKDAGEACLEYRTMLTAISNCNDYLQFFSATAVQSLIRHVRGLMNQGYYEEAYACLQELLKIEPFNAKTCILLGECTYALRDYKEAESYLLQALSLNPESDDILISLGVVCYDGGRKKEAITYFKKAEKLNPLNPDLLENYKVIGKAQRSLHHL